MPQPPRTLGQMVNTTPVRRNMTPAEWAALQSQGSQGMQPQVAPMSLADLVMEAGGSFLDEADVSKYLLPAALLGLVRYKRPGVSASARETAEKYRRTRANDPLPVALPGQDTRGLGRQYHGTSRPIDFMEEYTYNPLNIYGQGLYTTDAMDVAQGYAKKGKGTSPTVYRIAEQTPQRLFDMEAPLNETAMKALEPLRSGYAGQILEAENPRTLRELYDEMREWSRGEGLSADEVQEYFDSIAHNLERQGYTGLTHAGGQRTGTKPHQVNVYFQPQRDISTHPLRGKRSK